MDLTKKKPSEESLWEAETFQWFLEEQYTLSGQLEVRLWSVVRTGAKYVHQVRAEATLPPAAMDDTLAAVTLRQAESALTRGEIREVADLLTLLATY